MRATVIDELFFRVTFELRGPVPQPGDPALEDNIYRVVLDADPSGPTVTAEDSIAWTIRGVGGGRGGGGRGRAPRYIASGPGVRGDATIDGNTIAIEGILPAGILGEGRVAMSAETRSGTPGSTVDAVSPVDVRVSDIRSAELDLSVTTRGAGPFPVIYESFHHAGLPRPTDMACTVIEALGDRFDFFAWYSDFRVDNQEAGTPSTGPRGGNVTGTGQGSGRTSICI